jgi:hypothetical protein
MGMMRYMRRVTLGFLAVVSLIGFGSASALAALPEFSSPSGFPAKFTARSVASTVETTAGVKLTCKEGKGSGELTAAKAITQSLEQVGCELVPYGKCHSEGAGEGVIVESGESTLVYLSKSEKRVGVLPIRNANTKITCSLLKIEERGAALERIGPTNTKATKYEAWGSASKGVQSVTSYENEKGEEVKSILEVSLGSGFKQAGFTGATVATFEKEFSIVA